MANTQKCRFSHPLYDTKFEGDFPLDKNFREIEDMLVEAGFIEKKKGGYQYIFEDRICKLSAPLGDYVPEGVECMDIMIHGLLIILT